MTQGKTPAPHGEYPPTGTFDPVPAQIAAFFANAPGATMRQIAGFVAALESDEANH